MPKKTRRGQTSNRKRRARRLNRKYRHADRQNFGSNIAYATAAKRQNRHLQNLAQVYNRAEQLRAEYPPTMWYELPNDAGGNPRYEQRPHPMQVVAQQLFDYVRQAGTPDSVINL